MKIDGICQWDNLISKAALNILGKMNPGDVLRAKILEIQANELLLKLMDGTLFTARADINLESFKGQTLNFEIVKKDDEKILLKTLKIEFSEEASEHELIKNRLIELGIKPSSENIEIAREIKSQSLPVTIENITNTMEAIKGFKNLDIRKAIFFIASKLEFSEKNIEMLNDVLNKSSRLDVKLDRLLTALLKTDNKEIIARIAEKLSALKGQNISNNGSNICLEKRPAVYYDSVNEHIVNEFIDALLSEAAGKKIEALLKSNEFKDSLAEFIKGIKFNRNSSSEETEAFVKEHLNTGIQLSTKETRDLCSILSRMSARLIKDNGEQEANLSEKRAESIIRQTFENFHIKAGTGESHIKTEFKNLYRDIYMKLGLIKETLNMYQLSNQSEIKGSVDNIQSSIIFLNEINNYNTYIQIPINFWNFKSTGELYVLKRGTKKRKINPEDATMVLSLDMEHIGRVDSLIKLNKKNIGIYFRLENQEVINFFKEHYKKLYEMLLDKGYKLFEIKYRIADDKLNITNIESKVKEEFSFNPSRVDLKI